MLELKTFLNRYVYSHYEIHNPYITNETFDSIDAHLSWKPFYEASEKTIKEVK